MLDGIVFNNVTDPVTGEVTAGLLGNAATAFGTAVAAAIAIGVMVIVTKRAWRLAKQFLG